MICSVGIEGTNEQSNGDVKDHRKETLNQPNICESGYDVVPCVIRGLLVGPPIYVRLTFGPEEVAFYCCTVECHRYAYRTAL